MPVGDIVVTFSLDPSSQIGRDIPVLIKTREGESLCNIGFDAPATVSLPSDRPYFKCGTTFHANLFKLKDDSRSPQAVTMFWSGQRWMSKEAVNLAEAAANVPRHLGKDGPEEEGDSLRTIGMAGIGLGLACGVGVFRMDVTVPAGGFMSSVDDRVVNLDLVQRRNLYAGATGLLILCSVLALLASAVRKSK
jgi:hypothetical protein